MRLLGHVRAELVAHGVRVEQEGRLRALRRADLLLAAAPALGRLLGVLRLRVLLAPLGDLLLVAGALLGGARLVRRLARLVELAPAGAELSQDLAVGQVRHLRLEVLALRVRVQHVRRNGALRRVRVLAAALRRAVLGLLRLAHRDLVLAALALVAQLVLVGHRLVLRALLLGLLLPEAHGARHELLAGLAGGLDAVAVALHEPAVRGHVTLRAVVVVLRARGHHAGDEARLQRGEAVRHAHQGAFRLVLGDASRAERRDGIVLGGDSARVAPECDGGGAHLHVSERLPHLIHGGLRTFKRRNSDRARAAAGPISGGRAAAAGARGEAKRAGQRGRSPLAAAPFPRGIRPDCGGARAKKWRADAARAAACAPRRRAAGRGGEIAR